MKLSSAPDGSTVWAKPRSIVRPRRFSSSNRSGSVPVSARTSDDLPWSTWPAVATTVMRRPAVARAAATMRVSSDRVDRAEIEEGATVPGAGDHRDRCGAERDRRGRRRRRAPYDGIVTPGADPAPGQRVAWRRSGRRRHRRRTRRRPRRSLRPRLVELRRPARSTIRQNAMSVAARLSRYVSAVSCERPRGPAHRAGARAPADDAVQRSTRSARPAMMPACGPPSSLSPQNVMMSAPSAIALRRLRVRRRATPAARPCNQGTFGVEQSAADVGHHRHVERGEVGDRRLLDEPLDPVVARVHLHHHRDVDAGPGDRPLVVGEAGAVRGADVDEPSSPTAPSPRGRGTIRRSRRSRHG